MTRPPEYWITAKPIEFSVVLKVIAGARCAGSNQLKLSMGIPSIKAATRWASSWTIMVRNIRTTVLRRVISSTFGASLFAIVSNHICLGRLNSLRLLQVSQKPPFIGLS